jgi:hypothetical protein
MKMKKMMMAILAASLFASMPVMAAEHGAQHDAQCQRDCEMLVRNCGLEVDTLQQKISKLEHAVRNDGDKYTSDELQQLKHNLEDAKEMLHSLERGA